MFLSGVSLLHPINISKSTHLPLVDGYVQQEFRTVLPAAWSASHPNDGGAVVETLVRAADALHARPKSKPGVEGEFVKGTLVFSTPHTLRGQRAGHGGADSRTLIFTVLLLLVEGLDVSAAGSFNVHSHRTRRK